MSLTVHKYPLQMDDEFDVDLPIGRKILRFGFQNNKPVLWCLVDPEQTRTMKSRFRIAGTGHPITQDKEDLKYIGTDFVGGLVFHLFEVIQ